MNIRQDQELQSSGAALRTILESQYHASLAMLREAIELCPEDLWYRDDPTNTFWQIAYHALFFTHLYLQPNPEAFRPWAGHQSHVQHPDGIAGEPDQTSSLPLIPSPYSKAEVLAYWQHCDEMIASALSLIDLNSEESGFSWYPIPKLEHQIVNLRHLQHHTAQLIDRLRASEGIGTRWVGARRPVVGP